MLDTQTVFWPVQLPQGFVFRPGTSWVVRTNLVFQQALDPGTAVVNEVTASSNQIFDTCTHTYNNRPNGSISENVEAYSAPTTVEPSALSPIRATKSVRGVGAGVPGASPGDPNYDDLGGIQQGFGGTASSCESPNASNGFYRYPCVPDPASRRRGAVAAKTKQPGQHPGRCPRRHRRAARARRQGRDHQRRPRLPVGSDPDRQLPATTVGTVNPERKDLRIYYSTTVPSVALNAADIKDELLRGQLPTTDPCYADVNSRNWIQVTGATTSAAGCASARALKATVNYAEADDGILA